jgi:hypothetical protein
VSSVPKEAEHAAVVCVRRSAWERVTETEEFVGRFNFGSRFPQYLGNVSKMLSAGEGFRLDNCNVDWSSRACLVDFVRHVEDIYCYQYD